MEQTQPLTTAEIKRRRRLFRHRIQMVSIGFGLGFLSFLAAISLACQGKQRIKDPTDAQSARLIEKKESIGLYEYNALLFFDRDGQTNTAESVCFISTRTATAMEALRHVRVDQVQTISKWKSDLKAISAQSAWDDIRQKQ